jgi:flagellar basal body-associated protein FliL
MSDQLKVEAARKYLEAYRGKFPEDALINQLKSTGYLQEEIDAAIAGDTVSSQAPMAEAPIQESIPQEMSQQTVQQPSQQQQPFENSLQQEMPQQINPVIPQNDILQPNFVNSSQMIGSDFNYGSSSSDNKKKLIFAIVGVFLVVSGIVGYGFWNGSNIKNFAKKARGYKEVVESWEVTFNPNFNKISDDCSEILEELGKGYPGKAKRLHTNLTEYFTHSKSLVDSLKNIDKNDYYTKGIEDLVKKEDLDFMEKSDKVKKEIEEDVEELEKINFSF